MFIGNIHLLWSYITSRGFASQGYIWPLEVNISNMKEIKRIVCLLFYQSLCCQIRLKRNIQKNFRKHFWNKSASSLYFKLHYKTIFYYNDIAFLQYSQLKKYRMYVIIFSYNFCTKFLWKFGNLVKGIIGHGPKKSIFSYPKITASSGSNWNCLTGSHL